MWTGQLIAEAIGWIALICGSPLIFIYIRKVTTHFLYLAFPRDVIIKYEQNGVMTEAVYIKQSPFKAPSFRYLSLEELNRISPAHEK